MIKVTQLVLQMAKQLLSGHEGRRKKVYKCPAGKWTIAVGRNLEDTGLRESGIDFMLDNDVRDAYIDLRRMFSAFDDWLVERQAALIDMYVQLGYYRFRSFQNMIVALYDEDWDMVALEALDSKWARVDNPGRAMTIADLLRGTN